MSATFAAIAVALYVGHHVGDYWVQTDHQAKHKGDAGAYGIAQCLAHVTTYVGTQFVMLWLLWLVTDVCISLPGCIAALSVSGVTHYLADRREHGIMFWLARRLPGKKDFLAYGGPQGFGGAWALDQSWHLFWGVFVAALLGGSL